MAYVSRRYLRSKYESLKWDLEKVLRVLDDDLTDEIDLEDVRRVFPNIQDKCNAILNELNKRPNYII